MSMAVPDCGRAPLAPGEDRPACTDVAPCRLLPVSGPVLGTSSESAVISCRADVGVQGPPAPARRTVDDWGPFCCPAAAADSTLATGRGTREPCRAPPAAEAGPSAAGALRSAPGAAAATSPEPPAEPAGAASTLTVSELPPPGGNTRSGLLAGAPAAPADPAPCRQRRLVPECRLSALQWVSCCPDWHSAPSRGFFREADSIPEALGSAAGHWRNPRAIVWSSATAVYSCTSCNRQVRAVVQLLPTAELVCWAHTGLRLTPLVSVAPLHHFAK